MSDFAHSDVAYQERDQADLGIIVTAILVTAAFFFSCVSYFEELTVAPVLAGLVTMLLSWGASFSGKNFTQGILFILTIAGIGCTIFLMM